MDADFLLARADDLLMLGVRMTGVTIDPGSATALAGDGARIVLYLPPQHTAEEAVTERPPSDWVAGAQLAGVTRVAFDLSSGSRVPLTAAGVLGQCRRLSAVARPAGPLDTAVELPWRLVFAPVADDGTGVAAELGSLHSDGVLASPAGAVGVWMSRLGMRFDASGTMVARGRPAAEFELVPVDVDAPNTADPFTHSLTIGERNAIVGASGIAVGPAGDHPRATELSLTSYGGSISATGDWATMTWRHHATTGRDQRVIVTQQGYCYPFGLRVLITTVVERRTETPGSTDEAALRLHTTLRFLEQKQTMPFGTVFSRAFPFASVEVTQQVFEDVAADYFYIHRRPSPDTTKLQAQRDTLQHQADDDAFIWGPLVTPVWTAQNLAAYGPYPYYSAAADYLEQSGVLATLQQEKADEDTAQAALDAAVDQELADQRVLDQLERQGADQDTIDQQSQVIMMDVQAVQAAAFFPNPGLPGQIQAATARVNADLAVFQALLGTARPVANQALEAAGLGSAEASDWLDLEQQIATLDQQIEAAQAVDPPVDVAARLRQSDASGPPIQFPIRLGTHDDELRFAMPLLFVADVELPPSEVFPAYTSLDDPALPTALDQEWTAARYGVIGLQGETVDLVGSAAPQPQDRHELHAINILGPDPTPTFAGGPGDRAGGLFGPALGREAASDPALKWGMQVALPALRALGSEVPPTPAPLPGFFPPPPTTPPPLTVLPGLPLLPGMPVHFDPEYLADGETAKALLNTTVGVPINFTGHADRSGGLAALALQADAISRTLGPVQAAGLNSPDPQKLIGEGATLLGYKLQELLQAAALGDAPVPPPTIVTDTRGDGPPVVTMKWEKIRLRKHFALDTYPREGAPDKASLLTLSVVSSLDAVDTMCSVVDIDLIFPPDDDVIRLAFDRLVFTQHTTPQHADPPKLDVGPIDITFEGPLTFVQGLQQAVALLGQGASIRVRPTGIEAGFILPVPPVSCGVFNLSNITFRAGIVVPFGGDPVVVSIGFSSRTNPFNLSVLGLGGGGYVLVNIQDGGPSIEASLDFGALVAVSFGIASAEVHVFGGIRYMQEQDGHISLTGFIRIGGSVNLLGLVSVSIELVVELTYDFHANVLSGHATLVIEIDLTLWSDKVELDSGTWTFLGGGGLLHGLDAMAPGALAAGLDAAAVDPVGFAVWRRYRAAFGVRS